MEGSRAAWTLRSFHTHICPEDAWQNHPHPALSARWLARGSSHSSHHPPPIAVPPGWPTPVSVALSTVTHD